MTAPDPSRLPANRSALDWPGQAGVSDAVVREIERQLRRKRRSRLRAVASALVLAGAAGVTWRIAVPAATEASVEAAGHALVSMPDRQVLPDGTVVELNRGAKIAVEFGAGTTGPRRVKLISGEAHFQVTKNPARPFIVTAGNIEVRAVGTAFAVQVANAGVEVLVTEGTVAVERPGPLASEPLPAGPPLAVMEAGRRTVVQSAPSRAPAPPRIFDVPQEELSERLAWRAPRLEFTHTRLSEVLTLFNQHSSVRLTLGDATLGELRLSGIVRADNTSALLQLLGVEYGLDARPGSEGELVLVPAR